MLLKKFIAFSSKKDTKSDWKNGVRRGQKVNDKENLKEEKSSLLSGVEVFYELGLGSGG